MGKSKTESNLETTIAEQEALNNLLIWVSKVNQLILYRNEVFLTDTSGN